MTRSLRVWLTAAWIIPVLALPLSTFPAAQSATTGVPRAPDGKPDLTGVWQSGTNRRGTWEEANTGFGVGGTGRESPPATPAPAPAREPAPYTPEAAKKVLQSFNLRAINDPTARCLPAGVPRANSIGLFPIQIVQTPKQIVILYEYMNVFRIIPLDAKHPEDPDPTYMGDSVGRWEGETLVVDVTGFNDRTWLIGAGTFHTDALHVTERYTRVDKDTIVYDAVIEDPNVLTKPWEYRTTLMLREGTRLGEYVCAENNLEPERVDKLLKDGTEFRRR